MKLVSPVFAYGEKIPKKYTCFGENINPPLVISDVPAGAKSLVLIMDDPDVPKELRPDGMWDHWVIFDMPPTITEIKQGQEPQGLHGVGTGGNTNYFGCCPPDKEHRYFFKVYALDVKLGLPEGVAKKDVEKAMEGHILAKAELIGRFENI